MKVPFNADQLGIAVGVNDGMVVIIVQALTPAGVVASRVELPILQARTIAGALLAAATDLERAEPPRPAAAGPES